METATGQLSPGGGQVWPTPASPPAVRRRMLWLKMSEATRMEKHVILGTLQIPRTRSEFGV